MKTSLIFCVFSLLLSSAMSATSLPIAAQIDTSTSHHLQFSKIELDTINTGSYKSLVKYNDTAVIDLTFHQWDTPRGDTYHIYLDEQLVESGSIESDTTNVTFNYQEIGDFDLRIEVCELTECVSSNDTITIWDTDGTHLDPLVMNIDSNNLDFNSQGDTVIAAYFNESSAYGTEFSIDNIPANNITHLLYGYIPICGENSSLGDVSNYDLTALQTACADSTDYEIVILDPHAAFQKDFTPADHNEVTPIKGNYAMLMALKQSYPSLKVLATIGGETLSDQFTGLADKDNRDIFVNSVKTFLITWKFFDGINIDWYFQENNTEYSVGIDTSERISQNGSTYTLLMTELNQMLEELTVQTGLQYQLTSEISAHASDIAQVDYAEATEQLDYLFIKSFDFYGDDNTIGHHSGLYCDEIITELGSCDTSIGSASPTTDSAVQLLLKQGVAAEKIIMGVAMHGRGWSGVEENSFTQVDNPMSGTAKGKIFSIPSFGWQSGIVSYKAIKEYILGDDGQGIHDFVYGFDYYAQAPYLWNESTGELVSFDDENSILSKVDYIKSQKLGGIFSGELQLDTGDILNAMNQGLRSNELTQDEEITTEVDDNDNNDLQDSLQTTYDDSTSSIDFFKLSSIFETYQVFTDIQLLEFENIVPTTSLIPGSVDATELNTVAAIPDHITEEYKEDDTSSNTETSELAAQENDVIDADELINTLDIEKNNRVKKSRTVDNDKARINNQMQSNAAYTNNSDSTESNFSVALEASKAIKKDLKMVHKKNTKKINNTQTRKDSSLFGLANFMSQFETSLNTFNELVPEANEEQEYEELNIKVYSQITSLQVPFSAVKHLSKLTNQLKENFNNNRRDLGFALIDNFYTLKDKASQLYKKLQPLNTLRKDTLLNNEQ